MNTFADKTEKNKKQAVANAVVQNQHTSTSTFQFVDNRSQSRVQEKIQDMMQATPDYKKHLQVQKPLESKESTLLEKGEIIQRVGKARSAAIGGVIGGLGYASLAIANSWNPLGWGMLAAAGAGAIAGAIMGGRSEEEHAMARRRPSTLSEHYGYDSEGLSDEEGLSDASDQEELVRAPGKRTERRLQAGVYSQDRAVRRIARSIRRMRRGTASPRDREPILTRVGSSMLEMAPSHWRKDVGVYQTEEVEGGGRRRVGSARPYAEAGRHLDRDRRDEGLSQADMDDEMRGRLMGRSRGRSRLRSPDARRRMDEASGILMSDMARGSRGSELVDEMFEDRESFGRRFADGTGTYRPAHKGGSRYIQDETLRRRRGGSDDDKDSS